MREIVRSCKWYLRKGNKDEKVLETEDLLVMWRKFRTGDHEGLWYVERIMNL